MQLPRKLVLAGAILGIIPIVLGIVALVLDRWYSALIGLFGLFIKNNNRLCFNRVELQIIQGLEIGGVAAIGIGIITTVLLDMFIKNRWIKLLPLILLFAGSTATLIGLILPIICSHSFQHFGISAVLMIAAGVFGYILSAYFAFITGFGGHHHHQRHNSTISIVRENVRF